MRRRRRSIACPRGMVGRKAREIAKALKFQGSGQRHCACPSDRRPGFGRDQPGKTRDTQEGGDRNFRVASGRFGTRPVKPQSRRDKHRLGVNSGPARRDGYGRAAQDGHRLNISGSRLHDLCTIIELGSLRYLRQTEQNWERGRGASPW